MNASVHTDAPHTRIQAVSYLLKRPVRIWLAIGVFMIIMQVVIGGITRLTGSGLSITEWEIVTGTLPPLNQAQWLEEFDQYKATPQYEKINEGMSLGEFKFIYFWEYFHRLWARSMGFVFIIPFFIFLRRGWMPRPFIHKLLGVIALAGTVASFGWIMVASGLIDRPWVNAYKLTLHFSLALVLFSYLLWITYEAFQPIKVIPAENHLKRFSRAVIIVTCAQLVLGGMMSGMKAGLVAPTWPDVNGAFIPADVFKASLWTAQNFINYDASTFMPLLVQVLHRSVAYLLVIMVAVFYWRARQSAAPVLRQGATAMLIMVGVQLLLGIITVINSIGTIPVSWGVFHQAGGIILLGIALFVNYQFAKGKNLPVTDSNR